MTFKLPVPGRIVGRPDREKVYVASAVIPMGWINAVSLFQHLHRQAGLAREPGVQDSIRKRGGGATNRFRREPLNRRGRGSSTT